MQRICVDGVEFEVNVHGSGEPVLFLDAEENSLDHRGLAPGLGEGYAVIDYRRSGAGSNASLSSRAAGANAVLHELGIARAHVVGRSFGAATSLRLAVEHPTVVHTLALIEPDVEGDAMKPGEQLTQPTLSIVDRTGRESLRAVSDLVQGWGPHAEILAAPMTDGPETARTIAAWLARHPLDEIALRPAPWAAMSGYAWVAGVAASFVLARLGPGPGSATPEFPKYFRERRAPIMAATYIRSIAALCAFPFVVHVSDLIRRGERGSPPLATVALSSAVAGHTISIAGNAFHGVAAFNIDNISAREAQTLFYLGSVYYMAGLGLVPFLVAVGVGVLRTGVLPRWMGWLPILDAPVLLIGRLPVEKRSWEAFDGIAFLAFLSWVLAVSRKLQKPLAPAAPPSRRRRPSRRTLAIAGIAAAAVVVGAARR
jgi:pimeloyl-ACP methyl ester carboxylesterase